MDLMQEFKLKHMKKTIPSLRSGDVVKVHEKIKEGKKERIQIFEGIVTSVKKGKDLDASFTVRKISFGVGVEKTFPLHMPGIVKIETMKKIANRKSKLYYLRDMTDKQIRRKSELANFVVWKDSKSEEEEATLKAQKEAEAKEKAEAKAKEQAELDKKFAQAKGEQAQTLPKEMPTENTEKKQDKKIEKTKEDKVDKTEKDAGK